MCFNKHKYQELFFFYIDMENGSTLQIATKWHALCHLVPLPLKGTLCHLVSCGGTKWQNDTKWSIYNTYYSVLDHLVS